jgi:hypothetical protein
VTRGQTAAVLLLIAGAAVLTAALVWIGRTTLRLEAEGAEALRLAAQEEKVRLALWRLDSALTALVGSENARPAERFAATAPARGGEGLDRFTRRRFEADPRGRAKGAPVPVERLAAALDGAPLAPRASNPPRLPKSPAPPPAAPVEQAAAVQSQLNSNEFVERSRNVAGQIAFIDQPQPGPSRVETTFQPVWIDGELYLVRRVRQDGGSRLQALWIDWHALSADLLAGVRDLLPHADLLPVLPGESADPGRRLALLPLHLAPGPLAVPAAAAWTPARLTLAAGSGAIALVALAVGALLAGSLRQSQRRADFVSAVTHDTSCARR